MHIVKDSIKFSLTTILVLIALLACNQASAPQIKYGEKIKYAQGQPLNFPDLTLEFVGIKESPPQIYTRAVCILMSLMCPMAVSLSSFPGVPALAISVPPFLNLMEIHMPWS